MCCLIFSRETATNKQKKGRRPGSSDLCVEKSLILPLTHPRQCNGTSLPQLEIAHNQSTGRHISVLLKHINVKCSRKINGWQDSQSINTDRLFDITSARHRPILISCAFVRWVHQRKACWKNICEGQHRWNGRVAKICLHKISPNQIFCHGLIWRFYGYISAAFGC